MFEQLFGLSIAEVKGVNFQFFWKLLIKTDLPSINAFFTIPKLVGKNIRLSFFSSRS